MKLNKYPSNIIYITFLLFFQRSWLLSFKKRYRTPKDFYKKNVYYRAQQGIY